MKNLDYLFEAVKDVSFYVDKHNSSKRFVEFKNFDGNIEFAPIDSKAFKGYLAITLYELYGEDGNVEPGNAVKMLDNILAFQHAYQETEVFARTAGSLKGTMEYDLKTSDQNTVKITQAGWTISPKKRKFMNSSLSLAQKTPVQTDKSPYELLKPFVNLTGDDYTMYIIWLIQSYTVGSHHGLWIFADKGSGKSFLCKLTRRILDPSSLEISPFPESKDDLYAQLYNSSLCCFDNIRKIPNDISDILCGAITGSAIGKRTLYTTNDLSAMRFHNIIVLNSINAIIEQDDLAERMLILKLKKLKKNELRPDDEIWNEFDASAPEILGAIFSTLSKAMNEIKNVKEADLPRMAQSFIEMVAIAKALGIEEDDFRRIYENNKRELEQARLGSPVITAVREYMASVPSRKISGKASDIYAKICNNFSGDNALLPCSSSHFNRTLDKEHINLLKAGLRVNIDDTGAKGTEISIIKNRNWR